jgi:putative transposase
MDTMKIQKAFKFKLQPTQEQAKSIDEWLRSSRFVWNTWLKTNTMRFISPRIDGKRIPLLPLKQASFYLTDWCKSENWSFLKEVPRDVLKNTLIQQSKAYNDFFRSSKGFPRFKNQYTDKSGLLFSGLHSGIFNNRVRLAKLGWVVFNKKHPEFKNVISSVEAKKLSEYELKSKLVMRNATVSKKNNQYWVSMQVEYHIAEPIHKSNSTVGIDVGIAKFATLSNGDDIESINVLRKHEKKLAREQRKLARMVKKSNHWVAQKLKISKLHAKIANTRATFLHQETAKLATKHKIIVLEDIKIKNLSKSAKGTADMHGKNVKAKSGLNKSILDQGWGMFRVMLDYKLKWLGGKIVKVNPCKTSQKCISCGHTNKLNRTTQAKFCCVECGFTANADYVGAVNILNKYEPEINGG